MRTLISLMSHPYESRTRNPGDEYEASDEDARMLVLAGRASYADVEQKQQYLTRDMGAAGAARSRRRAAAN